MLMMIVIRGMLGYALKLKRIWLSWVGRKILAAAETLNLSDPQPDQECPHAVFA
jgi:hypothetical protein